MVELAPVSRFPTTKELELGVKDVTEALVEPVAELPVDVRGLSGVYPAISYMGAEPAPADEKVAVIVSAPSLPACRYQMLDEYRQPAFPASPIITFLHGLL